MTRAAPKNSDSRAVVDGHGAPPRETAAPSVCSALFLECWGRPPCSHLQGMEYGSSFQSGLETIQLELGFLKNLQPLQGNNFTSRNRRTSETKFFWLFWHAKRAFRAQRIPQEVNPSQKKRARRSARSPCIPMAGGFRPRGAAASRHGDAAICLPAGRSRRADPSPAIAFPASWRTPRSPRPARNSAACPRPSD